MAAESSAKAGGERRRVIVYETFAPDLETVLEVANFAFDAFFEGVDKEFTTGEVGNSGAVVFPGTTARGHFDQRWGSLSLVRSSRP